MDAATTTVESFKQVASGLPVAPLLELLSGMPHLWDENTQRQDYPGSAHKDTRCILLRMPDAILAGKGTAREWFRDLSAYDADLLPEALWSAVDAIVGPIVVATKARKLARVMIVELAPGGQVASHVDAGPYADHTDRVHVCLQGGGTAMKASSFLNVLEESEALSFVGGRALAPRSQVMQPGEAWWFNTKRLHEAYNWTEKPRIHLIIDLVSPDLRELRNAEPYGIQPELLSECWSEILPLCARHKDEIAHYQDIALNVDVPTYEKLESMGVAKLYTVRSLPDWKLIGYEVVMVSPNLHYQDSKQAKVDVLYIAPEHRRGRLGLKLIDYVDGMLRDEGCQVVYHHCKHTHDFGPLLKRLGYESIETIHGRRLDKE